MIEYILLNIRKVFLKEIFINGLRIKYEKDRELFNKLLKLNGVSKKKFCEKFSLSYSYVNAWGSFINGEEKKFPNWVFVYLKDIMYYKIAAIRIKLGIIYIDERLKNGENLTDLYKDIYSNADELSNEI